MASLETEINDDLVVNGEKRKNDEVVEKVKKKKKSKHVTETTQDTDEVIEKVKKKKKKSSEEESFETKEEAVDEKIEEDIVNISKNTVVSNAKSKPKKTQELPTVSIAVPGSILDNAQSPEFRTYLAGQIARAACIYKIDEVCRLFILLTTKQLILL